MNELNRLKEETKRITITISKKNYNKLKLYGVAGQSYDQVLSNIFADLEGKRLA